MRLPFRNYHKYTDYNTVPSGLKKLDFIVDTIHSYQKNYDNTKVKILDFGCGNGNIAIPLASLGYSLIGIDVDMISIQKAKMKNCFTNAKFKVMDAELLTQREGIFDFIICSEVIEHLQNPLIFLRTIKSLLSPMGFLIITIPNGYGLYELTARIERILKQFAFAGIVKKFYKLLYRRKTAILNIQTSNPESPHVNFFTFSTIKRALRSNGFTIIKVRHSDFISGIFTALRMNFPKKLWRTDCMIADYLPYYFVSGWYFVCRKST